MTILNKIITRSSDSASRIIQHEAVVVTPEKGIVRVLNQTAAQIWDLADGTHTVEEIVTILSDEFNVEPDKVQHDTIELITELEKKELVQLK